MLRFVFGPSAAAAFVLLAVGCASNADQTSSTDDHLVGDIAAMIQNPDGTFDVHCKDGHVESNVSAADVTANRVCGGTLQFSLGQIGLTTFATGASIGASKPLVEAGGCKAYGPNVAFTVSAPQAGAATISSPALPASFQSPGSAAGYSFAQPAAPPMTPLLQGGEDVTLSLAGGADIPAFSMVGKAPRAAVLSAPRLFPNATFSATRSAGLDLKWLGADDGGTLAYTSLYSEVDGSFVECTFPIASGAATIPAAVLSVMGAGKASFFFAAQNSKTTKQGHFDVQFLLSNAPALADTELTLQ